MSEIALRPYLPADGSRCAAIFRDAIEFSAADDYDDDQRAAQVRGFPQRRAHAGVEHVRVRREHEVGGLGERARGEVGAGARPAARLHELLDVRDGRERPRGQEARDAPEVLARVVVQEAVAGVVAGGGEEGVGGAARGGGSVSAAAAPPRDPRVDAQVLPRREHRGSGAVGGPLELADDLGDLGVGAGGVEDARGL